MKIELKRGWLLRTLHYWGYSTPHTACQLFWTLFWMLALWAFLLTLISTPVLLFIVGMINNPIETLIFTACFAALVGIGYLVVHFYMKRQLKKFNGEYEPTAIGVAWDAFKTKTCVKIEWKD